MESKSKLAIIKKPLVFQQWTFIQPAKISPLEFKIKRHTSELPIKSVILSPNQQQKKSTITLPIKKNISSSRRKNHCFCGAIIRRILAPNNNNWLVICSVTRKTIHLCCNDKVFA